MFFSEQPCNKQDDVQWAGHNIKINPSGWFNTPPLQVRLLLSLCQGLFCHIDPLTVHYSSHIYLPSVMDAPLGWEAAALMWRAPNTRHSHVVWKDVSAAFPPFSKMICFSRHYSSAAVIFLNEMKPRFGPFPPSLSAVTTSCCKFPAAQTHELTSPFCDAQQLSERRLILMDRKIWNRLSVVTVLDSYP